MTTLPALVPLASGDVAVTVASLYDAFIAGRSVNTRDAYGRDMGIFARFIGEADAKAALSRLIGLSHGEANGVLLAFRSAMVENGLTPSTINRRLSAVRSAAKLGRTLGFTNWVPEIDGVKGRKYRDTRGPGIEGTRSMLTQARSQGSHAAARDATIIRLFFDLALRRGEVVGLDLADVDIPGRRVWIMGKGRTEKEWRTLPVKTLAALREWIAIRAKFAPEGESALFIVLGNRARGQRITGRGVYYVISELGSDVGIKTRPHGLRHASITAALDANNGDVRAVQQHARHASSDTTIRYDDNRRDLAGRIAAGLADAL